MAQDEVIRSVILYPLRNENKDVIIFRYILIIDSRDQKENFTIALHNRILAIFKIRVIFGTPGSFRDCSIETKAPFTCIQLFENASF